MTLRNRMVLPAMGTNLGTEGGYVTDRLKNYHRARAKGGVGLSIVELVCVDPPKGKVSPRQLCIDDDRFIPDAGPWGQIFILDFPIVMSFIKKLALP
jgi:2,4-dienoyl-CoA reductase-like NADH-dependent reductase (Old Yellow Enzyme family)